MRFSGMKTLWSGLAAVTALTLCLACKDSNAVTAPVSSPMAAVNVSGTWAGTFTSDSDACGASQITVKFQQSGSQVTGNISGIFVRAERLRQRHGERQPAHGKSRDDGLQGWRRGSDDERVHIEPCGGRHRQASRHGG